MERPLLPFANQSRKRRGLVVIAAVSGSGGLGVSAVCHTSDKIGLRTEKKCHLLVDFLVPA